MSQSQQQQQAQPRKDRGKGFKYAFKRSTWITAAWNWFLMLAGKAAEPVLTISVIYSCARLLPGISLPLQLDNTVFICQMIALDIGGLGLRKLANQARKDGNEDGSTLAGRVSTALLTIMGINVALSVLESVAPLDPTFVKATEGVLLIARAAMAVLYAYVIHSLHGENNDGETDENNGSQPHANLPVQMEDLQQIIGQALAEQAMRFDQPLQVITAEQARMLAAIQRLQTASATAPQVDTQAIITGVINQLEARFNAAVKRMESEMERRIYISSVGEMAQSGGNGTVSNMPDGMLASGPKTISLPQRNAAGETPKYAADVRKTVPLGQNGIGETTDYKAILYPLLDEDSSRQVADLMAITGLPKTVKTTVWRHWNRYHEEHGTRGQARIVSGEAEHVVSETITE